MDDIIINDILTSWVFGLCFFKCGLYFYVCFIAFCFIAILQRAAVVLCMQVQLQHQYRVADPSQAQVCADYALCVGGCVGGCVWVCGCVWVSETDRDRDFKRSTCTSSVAKEGSTSSCWRCGKSTYKLEVSLCVLVHVVLLLSLSNDLLHIGCVSVRACGMCACTSTCLYVICVCAHECMCVCVCVCACMNA